MQEMVATTARSKVNVKMQVFVDPRQRRDKRQRNALALSVPGVDRLWVAGLAMILQSVICDTIIRIIPRGYDLLNQRITNLRGFLTPLGLEYITQRTMKSMIDMADGSNVASYSEQHMMYISNVHYPLIEPIYSSSHQTSYIMQHYGNWRSLQSAVCSLHPSNFDGLDWVG